MRASTVRIARVALPLLLAICGCIVVFELRFRANRLASAKGPVWLRNTPSNRLKGSKPFDSHVWKVEPRLYGNYTRWLMLADLRSSHLEKLRTKSEATTLLGSPDDLQITDTNTYLIYTAYVDGPASPMKPMLALEVSRSNLITRIAVYFQPENDAPSKAGYIRAFGPDWAPTGADLN